MSLYFGPGASGGTCSYTDLTAAWSGLSGEMRPTNIPFMAEIAPGPKAPEVEAREAVERQRKDEADRQERETAAKRAHELAVLKASLDHRLAMRQAVDIGFEGAGVLMAAAAFLSAVLTGLIALAIP